MAIMTWNIQTLFDGVENGTEYDDYRETAGWTREKYRGRLNVIANAIGGMERKPDIIALQEVESAQVLEDLAFALSAQGYGWTGFSIIPGMALGIGLLSRFPLLEVKSHTVYIDGDIAPRPMLEARIDVPPQTADSETGNETNNAMILFVCHWKSKLGGDDATESTRRASARIIVRRIRELAESEPDIPVIVMGDLNENHDDFYRRSGSIICALLPDDPRAAEDVNMYGIDGSAPESAAVIAQLQKDFIVLSRNSPPEPKHFPSGAIILYSPWSAELRDGSYYYRNAWETIDHFLLSGQLFDETGWEFDTCLVINTPPFANVNGYPVMYNNRTGSGMSDHLPLLLFLKRL